MHNVALLTIIWTIRASTKPIEYIWNNKGPDYYIMAGINNYAKLNFHLHIGI